MEGTIETVRTAISDMNDDDLPVKKSGYIKLASLSVKFGPFTFNNEEYRQHCGLTMGSLLSAVMASLFMAVFERDDYVKTVRRGAYWFCYMDDVIAIVPGNTVTEDKLRRLNAVHGDNHVHGGKGN